VTDPSEPIEEALEALRSAVGRVVREEQLRDQLTGLGNDQALTEWIKGAIEQQDPFWTAFLEVDRFKEINDRYGYTNADTLLQKIAEQLSNAASYFPSGIVAFRAHGDEFYLVGRHLPDEDVADTESALNHIRESVGRMRVKVRGVDAPMSCTISVGWTTSADGAHEGERGLRHNLELATSAAKLRGRNQVVRFNASLSKNDVVSLRSDCSACHSSYSVSIPRSALTEAATLHCPNCGQTSERPPVPEPKIEKEEPEI
jgi:diguanylate cyclase (GGDEF)-like protein